MAVGCNGSGCLEWDCRGSRRTFPGGSSRSLGGAQVQVRGPREEHFGQKSPNMEADLKEASPLAKAQPRPRAELATSWSRKWWAYLTGK